MGGLSDQRGERMQMIVPEIEEFWGHIHIFDSNTTRIGSYLFNACEQPPQAPWQPID